jgi:hypothetical protein
LSYPAVPWTVLLGVAFLYWVFVLLGVAAFDGGDALHGTKAAGEALTGALKGAGEAITGGLKGAGDAAMGSAKAAGEAARNLGSGGTVSGTGSLSWLGLGKVPSTISGSLLIFFGWLFTMFGSSWLGGDAGLLAKSGVLGGALLLSVLSTSVAVRPMVKAFESAAPARRSDFIGKVCEITSGSVDARFGTAHVGDGGAGLNLNVACGRTNELKKGQRAVIVDFDEQTETWQVEPLDWLEPQEVEALNDPARVHEVLSARVRTRG